MSVIVHGRQLTSGFFRSVPRDEAHCANTTNASVVYTRTCVKYCAKPVEHSIRLVYMSWRRYYRIILAAVLNAGSEK